MGAVVTADELAATAEAVLIRLGSSLRVRAPEQTLKIAESQLAQWGVTRVTDTTRLDRLGLPVFASIRPRGLVLRVHAGKGLTPLEAQVGAAMEGLEFAVAEPRRSAWAPVDTSLGDMLATFGGRLSLPALRPRIGGGANLLSPVRALRCEELVAGVAVLCPAELVFVPFDPPGGALFGGTSTGLASGNSADEATLHALLEVLERDAISMNKLRDRSLWVEPASLPDPLRTLALGWEQAGVRLAVRSIPNALALPCFEAVLHESASDSVNFAGGSGMHFDRAIALTRAVCEAAQSRLTHIHGGREDVTDFYSKYAPGRSPDRATAESRLQRTLFDRSRQVAFADIAQANMSAESPAAMLASLLLQMARCGFDVVLRHRFAVDLGGLHVVKLIVPRAEDIEGSPRRIGPRLFASAIADA